MKNPKLPKPPQIEFVKARQPSQGHQIELLQIISEHIEKCDRLGIDDHKILWGLKHVLDNIIGDAEPLDPLRNTNRKFIGSPLSLSESILLLSEETQTLIEKLLIKKEPKAQA